MLRREPVIDVDHQAFRCFSEAQTALMGSVEVAEAESAPVEEQQSGRMSPEARRPVHADEYPGRRRRGKHHLVTPDHPTCARVSTTMLLCFRRELGIDSAARGNITQIIFRQR